MFLFRVYLNRILPFISNKCNEALYNYNVKTNIQPNNSTRTIWKAAGLEAELPYSEEMAVLGIFYVHVFIVLCTVAMHIDLVLATTTDSTTTETTTSSVVSPRK